MRGWSVCVVCGVREGAGDARGDVREMLVTSWLWRCPYLSLLGVARGLFTVVLGVEAGPGPAAAVGPRGCRGTSVARSALRPGG